VGTDANAEKIEVYVHVSLTECRTKFQNQNCKHKKVKILLYSGIPDIIRSRICCVSVCYPRAWSRQHKGWRCSRVCYCGPYLWDPFL